MIMFRSGQGCPDVYEERVPVRVAGVKGIESFLLLSNVLTADEPTPTPTLLQGKPPWDGGLPLRLRVAPSY